MAIQKQYENTRFSVKNAYYRVYEVAGSKENILATIEILDSKESTEALSIMSIHFKPEMANKNYHQQAYEFLKTLPDFANCVDC